MTEDEIITNANELIDNCNCYLEDDETDDETFKWFEMEKKTIQNLLDLYQKEKEKNKELDKIKFIITDKLPPDMKYVCYCNTDFERLFGSDYISKDKINKEIDSLINNSTNFNIADIELLREKLLEENNENIN